MRILPYISAITAAIAGVIHLLIAPIHFHHALVHGIFFGVVGIAQTLWALATLSGRFQDQFRWYWSGNTLSGGIIIIWILAHWVTTPFATEHHTIDATGILTKLNEFVTFIILGISYKQDKVSYIRVFSSGLGQATLVGLVFWGSGLLITPLLPSLAEDPDHSHTHNKTAPHSHNHTTHNHSLPTPTRITTAAYFTIVNTNPQSDTLVNISGDIAETITLHQTAIDDQDIARMYELEGVTLSPHTRVEFAPVGYHVMLEGLKQNLSDGDIVQLNLHMASRKVLPIEFIVQWLPPEDLINFTSLEQFQISNAWIRATVPLNSPTTVVSGDYDWQLPEGFPMPRIPQNNPITQAKVELGRHLFYDLRLSANQTMSCASCHEQELAFTDGKALPIGSTGEQLLRNSMTLTNVAYYITLTWANPNLTTLERQVVIPMFGEHPIELGITGNEETVINRFRQDAQYQNLFAAAFPEQTDPFTFNNITLALSTFLRTLISINSPYDQYLQGDPSALSPEAKRGMELFFSEELECHHCHTGFNFSLSTVTANSTFEERPFFNTGLYNIDSTGAYPLGNTGIHEITNNPQDMGRFRPPTLRNIALTAPYMHDGSIENLEEVIQFYMDGGRVISEGLYKGDGRQNPYKSGLVAGFTLTDQEVADLIAFLNSLTDETFITDTRFSDPFKNYLTETEP